MYQLSYGLFVLTARMGDRDNGCIINTAGQVTSTPNRISITVNKDNFTHDLVKESGKFNISVLSERAGFETFQHFGFQSGKTVNKFDGYHSCKRSTNGLYYITEGTNAYISAAVEQAIDLEAIPCSLLQWRTWMCLPASHQPPMLIISPISSPSRKSRLSPEKPYGVVLFAATYMKGKNSRQILSALYASILLRILKG